MPFTGSHPAAVLPFFRIRVLVPSALVTGSMAPDIPYFTPFPVGRELSHSPTGVVTVDLAMGLLVFVAWQAFVAGAVVAIAPPGVRVRLGPDQPAGLRHHLLRVRGVLAVVASLVVGGYTHVGWDAFTHGGSWGPNHIPWLLEQHGPLQNYRYAQYASGVVGAAILALAAAHWWRTTPPNPAHSAAAVVPAAGRRVAVGAWAAFVLAGSVSGLVAGSGPLRYPWGANYRSAAFLGLTRGGAASGVVLLAFALGWTVAARWTSAGGVRRGP